MGETLGEKKEWFSLLTPYALRENPRRCLFPFS